MAKYRKFLVAAGAFLGVVSTAISDGEVDWSDAISIFIAGASAAGVFLAKNKEA